MKQFCNIIRPVSVVLFSEPKCTGNGSLKVLVFFPFEANSVIPDHSGNYNIYKKSRRFRAIVKYIFNSIPN